MGDIFINKKRWNTFTKDELDVFKEVVFKYYRLEGFPYFPTDNVWRSSELSKLKKYDFTRCIDRENKIIKQTMHGLSYCWSFQPHNYKVECNNKRSVYDTFMNDALFKQVITKRIKMGDNISDNGIRKMLKIFTGTQGVSNFRPTAAAAIYSMFTQKGDQVWDMSSGYGGRALGAYLAGVNYIGTDPSTLNHKGVVDMCDNLNYKCTLLNSGSEVPLDIGEGTIDFCFTSPPYFDTERYSQEETQSYLKYPTKQLWLNGFLKDTFNNCYKVLKSNKYMVINIANTSRYKDIVEDTINLALSIGFSHEDTWGLQLSSLAGGGYKTEPLLIFKKG